jgi:hypothetical protein
MPRAAVRVADTDIGGSAAAFEASRKLVRAVKVLGRSGARAKIVGSPDREGRGVGHGDVFV